MKERGTTLFIELDDSISSIQQHVAGKKFDFIIIHPDLKASIESSFVWDILLRSTKEIRWQTPESVTSTPITLIYADVDGRRQIVQIIRNYGNFNFLVTLEQQGGIFRFVKLPHFNSTMPVSPKTDYDAWLTTLRPKPKA